MDWILVSESDSTFNGASLKFLDRRGGLVVDLVVVTGCEETGAREARKVGWPVGGPASACMGPCPSPCCSGRDFRELGEARCLRDCGCDWDCLGW